MVRKPLPLTFAQTLCGWRDVALGNAGGFMVRYHVERISRGAWIAVVTANGVQKAPVEYSTRRAARAHCRRDFERRQLVRAA